jgi:N-acetyl-gamma-glutamyl-phosphate reductase
MYALAMYSVGVIGASGYAGAELLRLVAGHPDLEVVLATGDTQAGTPVAELYPSLAAAYGDLAFASYESGVAEGLDGCFLALPHGASQALVPELRPRVKWLIDLAADFRLHDADLYPRWYGEAHSAPDLLGEFAFGLPELFRDRVAASTAVAAPGCYPTAATLPLAPLVGAGLIEGRGIIVDAASGVSGAGRPPKPTTSFCTVDEDFTAYGLLDHRHTPEIEQAVAEGAGRLLGDVQVLFTPHLAPMNRGILATCYARPTGTTSTAALLDCFHAAYDAEPFVVVTDGSPSTKATLGSNAAHLTARYDDRTGYVVAICALDNLVKGAAGQALQCANILAGFDEVAGLSAVGVYP